MIDETIDTVINGDIDVENDVKPTKEERIPKRNDTAYNVATRMIESYRQIERFVGTIDYTEIKDGAIEYADAGCAIRCHRIVEVKPGSIIVANGVDGKRDMINGILCKINGKSVVIPNTIIGWIVPGTNVIKEVINLPKVFDISSKVQTRGKRPKIERIETGDLVRVNGQVCIVTDKNSENISVKTKSGKIKIYGWAKVSKVKNQEEMKKNINFNILPDGNV
jgi:hypothetical protein